MRRVFRVTVKLGLIVGVGVGIAIVIKKLTAPPAEPNIPLEPWPPLKTDAPSASKVAEAVEEAIIDEAVAEAVAEEIAGEAGNN